MGADIEAFVLREVSARAARLQADVQRTSGSARSANSLGVLYARYGLLDKAKAVFEDLVRKEEYAPALVNLGNIAKLEGRTDNALKLYERAYKSAPSSALVVLALARTNHELENYGLARKQYADLARLDPALAARYSYLDLKGEEGSRAAEAAGLRDAVEWMEAK
jgi:tetratricopeptide (TPR) repeat protein